MRQALVAGFGCAGYHAVKAMRESGYTGDIHVFTDSENAPANPMLTTYYAADKIPYDALTPFGSLDEIARRYRLKVHAGQRVAAIDYGRKLALCDDGAAYPWDKLLLATGAAALVPAFPGSGLPEVYTMRTVDDALRLRERLDRGGVRKAVVVGASMAGIKVVELLQQRGVETTLADLATRIFPLATLPEAAALIERRVEAKGVRLLFGRGISSITAASEGLTTHFGKDTAIACDLVVLCIGTQANTSLAGRTVEVRRGVMTDCRMQTSVPDVYAAGDCCEGRNLQNGETQIIGLWANAARQGAAAGKSMAGIAARYEGSVPHNITHFFSMDFISFGDNRRPGRPVRYRSPDGSILLLAVIEGERIQCLNILGCCEVGGILKSYFVKRLLECGAGFGHSERIRLQNREIPCWLLRQLEHLPIQTNSPEFCEAGGIS